MPNLPFIVVTDDCKVDIDDDNDVTVVVKLLTDV